MESRNVIRKAVMEPRVWYLKNSVECFPKIFVSESIISCESNDGVKYGPQAKPRQSIAACLFMNKIE